MSIKFTILLYSKYSPASKKIMKIIDDSTVDFTKYTKIASVCIDNEDIRQQIINSKIDILYVPCILIVYEDGGIEKYEGEDAFKWVEDIIQKYSPVQPQQQMQLPPQEMPMQPPQQQMPMQPPQQQMPMQLPPQEMPMQPPQQQMPMQPPQQQMPMQPPQQQMQPAQQQMHNKKRVKSKPSIQQNSIEYTVEDAVENFDDNFNATPIEHVNDDYEEEEQDENPDDYDNIEIEDIFPPKQASIRSGPGNYELNSEFGKKSNQTKVIKAIKTNVSDVPTKKGKTDVMSAALEMQKMREKEDSSKPRYG